MKRSLDERHIWKSKWKLNWHLSTPTEAFINQKSLDVCEHTIKMVLHVTKFTVCSHTFILFWLTKTPVTVKRSQVSMCSFRCVFHPEPLVFSVRAIYFYCYERRKIRNKYLQSYLHESDAFWGNRAAGRGFHRHNCSRVHSTLTPQETSSGIHSWCLLPRIYFFSTKSPAPATHIHHNNRYMRYWNMDITKNRIILTCKQWRCQRNESSINIKGKLGKVKW